MKSKFIFTVSSNSLLSKLRQHRYETETYKKWTTEVNRVVQTNLEKPLLVRNEETLLLTMNFDPEVCKKKKGCRPHNKEV